MASRSLKSPDGSPRALPIAIACAVALGGVAALSWETIWYIRASLSFGVSAFGSALTLAATMGGMAAGSLAAGSWLRHRAHANPLRLYAILELTIGLCGLVMLPGFHALEALDTAVFGVAPSTAPLLHGLGIALILAPATLAMGATIPIFQLVARRHAMSIARLYGLNTAGAAVGVLLLTFLALPRLGVAWTCVFVAGVNAVGAATAFFLASLPSPSPSRAPSPSPSPSPSLPRDSGDAEPAVSHAEPRPQRGPLVPVGLATLTTFATGFATFGLEIVWFRAMRAAFWSTSATFAILLAAVLIPLAIGARLVPRLRRTNVSPGVLLGGAGLAILLTTPIVERFDLLAWQTGASEAALFYWFLLTLATFTPAILLLSTALPWFLEDFPSPQTSGRLYAANALGSVVGALTAGWVLLPMLGFSRAAWGLGGVVVAVALVLASGRGKLWIAVAAVCALGVAVALSSSPGYDRMHGEATFGRKELVALDEGPDFTTSVIELANGDRALLIDGFTATTEKLASGHYMRAMGSLPAMLHPEPTHGLVICFGTGQTANALRRASRATIDVVDVSRAVLDMAPRFPTNEGVLSDERVRAIRMDGRAWLRRTDAQYDVITLEPMPPNFSGVNALYSREFYEIAASRLGPGGVLAQWLPIHLLNPEHAAAVAATFHAVLPDSILWIDPIGQTGILLGRTEAVDGPLGSRWPGLARGADTLTLRRGQIPRAVLLDPRGLAAYAATGTVVTDDNRLLETSGLRAGLGGLRGQRLAATNLEILRRIARESRRPPSQALDARP